jgi:integrase
MPRADVPVLHAFYTTGFESSSLLTVGATVPGASVARRKALFGNIRHLASGNWHARYYKDGAWYNAPEIFKAKADANAWLATVQADITRGLWVDPTAGKMTLDEYARTLLAGRSDLRPRTRELNEGLLQRVIIPKLGSKELGRIKTPDIRTWYAAVAKERTPGQAAKAYRLLRMILGTATSDGVIAANPCNIRGAGNEHTPERQIPSLEVVEAVVGQLNERYRALVLSAAFAGIRLGELSALERRDIDLLRKTIKVERNAQDVVGQGRVVGPPKSAAGARTVAIPPSLVTALEAHLATFVGSQPTSLVFTMDKGGPLVRTRWALVFKRAATAAGAPGLHFHDLRHLAGTLAAATGASTRELMSRLGHSTARAALIYQHATEERDHGIASGIEAILQSAARRPSAPIVRIAN